MPNIIRILRTATAGTRPTGKQSGEPYVNFSDLQFGVFDSTPVDLIGVRFFSTLANYIPGDHVVEGGVLYVCATTTGPGAFNIADWSTIGGGGGLPLTGGTLTGPLILDADPTVNLGAATKQYVDAVAALIPSPGLILPNMDGLASAGVLPGWSRADHVHPTDTSLVPLAGGVMTGALTTVAPVANGDATNKLYVDTLFGSLRLFLGTWQVAANTPDITGGAVNAGDYYIAITANPLTPETAPGAIPGIGGTLIAEGDIIIWDGTQWNYVRGSGLTLADADALYVAIAGGVMTGNLVLNATQPPLSNNLVAATTEYVDNAIIDAGTFP
jgi:hypothetical protein